MNFIFLLSGSFYSIECMFHPPLFFIIAINYMKTLNSYRLTVSWSPALGIPLSIYQCIPSITEDAYVFYFLLSSLFLRARFVAHFSLHAQQQRKYRLGHHNPFRANKLGTAFTLMGLATGSLMTTGCDSERIKCH